MTTTPERTFEPAALPMYAVEAMIRVRALSNKGGLKKGADYFVGMIRKDGKVRLVGDNTFTWHDMDAFVQLLEYYKGAHVPAVVTATPQPEAPANDNKK